MQRRVQEQNKTRQVTKYYKAYNYTFPDQSVHEKLTENYTCNTLPLVNCQFLLNLVRVYYLIPDLHEVCVYCMKNEYGQQQFVLRYRSLTDCFEISMHLYCRLESGKRFCLLSLITEQIKKKLTRGKKARSLIYYGRPTADISACNLKIIFKSNKNRYRLKDRTLAIITAYFAM